MIVVGVVLAPIVLAALVAVWLVLVVVVEPLASGLADPKTRGGCLTFLGVIAATGILHYLLESQFGTGGGGGWTDAAIALAGVLAVVLWCGFCASLLRDPDSRWGLAALLVFLGLVAAACFAHGSQGVEWAQWVFAITAIMALLGVAVAGVYVLARILRSPTALGLVVWAVVAVAAVAYFVDFSPEGWMESVLAMVRRADFAWLALTDLSALLAVAGYGVLAAIVAAALRRDAEARFGCLGLLSAIAVAVPLALLLNGSLSLWLAIPIALIIACVVSGLCLGIPSQTRVPLSAGVVVVGALVAYLVGVLTAGPGEGGQGALGGAAPEPIQSRPES